MLERPSFSLTACTESKARSGRFRGNVKEKIRKILDRASLEMLNDTMTERHLLRAKLRQEAESYCLNQRRKLKQGGWMLTENGMLGTTSAESQLMHDN